MSTKDCVLSILEQNRGREVSGQEISGALGVSRTAVWKAIETLRSEGHEIGAATNRGYRLSESSGLLSEPGVRAFLPPEWSGIPISVFGSVDSTNSVAKRMAVSGAEHGSLLLAEQQTAGRGRMSRSFFSPAGEGLYMSLVLRPEYRASEATLITIAAAVAVCRAVAAMTSVKPAVKWVNDLYVDGRKICGILTEAVGSFESGSVESVVVGVGLNCGSPDFPDELRSVAGSLRLPPSARGELAARIAANLLDICKKPVGAEIVDEYRSLSLMTGRRVRFHMNGDACEAVVSGIGGDGSLVVLTDAGDTLSLRSGEVELLTRPVPGGK